MKKIILLTACIVGTLLSACGNKNYSKMAMATDEYAVAETAAYDSAGVMMEEGKTVSVGEVGNPNRKLIKSTYLNLEVEKMTPVVNAITNKVEELGGYIESTDASYPTDDNQNYVYTNITARIPSDRLDEFVEIVESNGNVVYKSQNVQDVTLQYTDTESRKESLKLEEKRLNELLSKAKDVSDIVAIESELSNVRYQLTSIESQLRIYDNDIDYSRVDINITEKEASVTALTIIGISLGIFIILGTIVYLVFAAVKGIKE